MQQLLRLRSTTQRVYFVYLVTSEGSLHKQQYSKDKNNCTLCSIRGQNAVHHFKSILKLLYAVQASRVFFNITYRQHVTFRIFQRTESLHVPGPEQEETCAQTSSTTAILRHFAAPSSAPSNGHYQKPDTKCNKLTWTSKQDYRWQVKYFGISK